MATPPAPVPRLKPAEWRIAARFLLRCPKNIQKVSNHSPAVPIETGEMKTNPKSFLTTRWSIVAHCNGPDQPRARQALEDLCQLYWYPIYSAIRRAGHSHDDSEDLAQSFFTHALRKDTFGKADAARGRFRTFMLACLTNFLRGEHVKANTGKRGGGKVLSLDDLNADERYRAEPRDELSPDRLFERNLALEVLRHAEAELESNYQGEKSLLLNELRGHIFEAAQAETYAAISIRLNIPQGTLKSQVHDFKKRLREIIRDRVRETLANPDELDDEIANLQQSI